MISRPPIRLDDEKTRCVICRGEFVKYATTQKTCTSFVCKREHRRQNELKKAAKAERRARRERKQELKPLQDLLREAQRHVNHYIRLSKPPVCISCGSAKAVHAGHYRTTKAAPNLRFTEDNIWPQCVQCNHMLSGNVSEYRRRLVSLIGAARVEALENDNTPHKWSRDEVLEIGRKYRKLVREAERADI